MDKLRIRRNCEDQKSKDCFQQQQRASIIWIMTQNLCQELDKVGGLDEGDKGGELGVEGEQVEDGARLPCARVQWHREVEGSPDQHGQNS